MPDSKTPSVQTLKQSLQRVEDALAAQTDENAPAVLAQLERRLQAITAELDNSSEKMVAYKLKRVAESKMVAQASAAAKAPAQYQSTTFQCKSDLDQCLLGAPNALAKALCYVLFIRCAVKG